QVRLPASRQAVQEVFPRIFGAEQDIPLPCAGMKRQAGAGLTGAVKFLLCEGFGDRAEEITQVHGGLPLGREASGLSELDSDGGARIGSDAKRPEEVDSRVAYLKHRRHPVNHKMRGGRSRPPSAARTATAQLFP